MNSVEWWKMGKKEALKALEMGEIFLSEFKVLKKQAMEHFLLWREAELEKADEQKNKNA